MQMRGMTLIAYNVWAACAATKYVPLNSKFPLSWLATERYLTFF